MTDEERKKKHREYARRYREKNRENVTPPPSGPK